MFKDLIKKYFRKVIKRYYEQIAGTKEDQTYLHDEMLDEEYSPDMTFESISGRFTRITADVVAYDSPLPIKRRGAISAASGEIPKSGLKFLLNEKQMNTLIILTKFPGRIKELIRKLFGDSKSCILGIKELMEEMFLIGLSNGATLIKEEKNTGTGVRVDYNIPDSNKFGATVKWSNPEALPLDDIQRVVSESDNIVDTIWMDAGTARLLKTNDQMKQNFAFNLNILSDKIPTLSNNQLSEYFATNLGLRLRIIDRAFRKQKNGKTTRVKAWKENMIVFTSGSKIGSLAYSTLAEEVLPTEGVSYTKPNKYILISNEGTTDPVSRKTTGQAIAIPVLQNVDTIFYLDTEEAETDEQTEGDDIVTYKNANYPKQVIVDGLNKADDSVNAKITNKDITLLNKINSLSQEGIKIFEQAIANTR
ncbi:major capsid protein [Aquimarina hainanensis]|uniref:Major capsid protein n=1 Tax=Aquimarina hainanensis TaxID=1578017 RepID=A0ABW5NB77_9FLAO